MVPKGINHVNQRFPQKLEPGKKFEHKAPLYSRLWSSLVRIQMKNSQVKNGGRKLKMDHHPLWISYSFTIFYILYTYLYIYIHTHIGSFKTVSCEDVLQWRFFLCVPGAGPYWRSSRRRLLLAPPPPLTPPPPPPSPTPTSLWKSESVRRFSSASRRLNPLCVRACVREWVRVLLNVRAADIRCLKKAKENLLVSSRLDRLWPPVTPAAVNGLLS